MSACVQANKSHLPKVSSGIPPFLRSWHRHFIALGIIEFLDAGGDDLGTRRALAVVNRRLGDFQRLIRGFGRHVVDKILRKTARRDFRDEVHHDALAMRELQVLVHPRLSFGREVRGQLAGRKHHLVIAIGQMVAIHVHIVELVIETYGLRLLVGLKQRRTSQRRMF